MHFRAPGSQRFRQKSGLCLQMNGDGDPFAGKWLLTDKLATDPVKQRHIGCHPVDLIAACGGRLLVKL